MKARMIFLTLIFCAVYAYSTEWNDNFNMPVEILWQNSDKEWVKMKNTALYYIDSNDYKVCYRILDMPAEIKHIS